MTDLKALSQRNADRWVKAKITRDATAVAKRLAAMAAKARYQIISNDTGVPWFVIAVIHEREASQRWDRQLGQGDPLDRQSIHEPVGRGPFFDHDNDPPGKDAFYRSALDALIDCPPRAAKWQDWSAGGALTLLEQYNGLGYASKGLPSPYIWAGTDQYVKGKYTSDGHYDPEQVDQQLGCVVMLKAMIAIDPTITFTGATIVPPKPLPEAPEIKLPAPGQVQPVASTFWERLGNLFKPKG